MAWYVCSHGTHGTHWRDMWACRSLYVLRDAVLRACCVRAACVLRGMCCVVCAAWCVFIQCCLSFQFVLCGVVLVGGCSLDVVVAAGCIPVFGALAGMG